MERTTRTAAPGLAAISAHRGGDGGGTREAFAAAAGTGAEYVEFDIRRTADGEFVVHHDAAVSEGSALAGLGYPQLCALAGYQVPRAEEVMRLIARKAIGHLDLKERGGEHVIIGRAMEILGPRGFVATTLHDASVAAIKERFPRAQVGLSLGRDLSTAPWRARLPARAQELYPLRRIRACGADWAAIHQRLAVAGVLRQCHRSGIRAMIWTVNGDLMLRHWLADPRVDVVVTDRPWRAAAVRAGLRSAGLRPAASGRS